VVRPPPETPNATVAKPSSGSKSGEVRSHIGAKRISEADVVNQAYWLSLKRLRILN